MSGQRPVHPFLLKYPIPQEASTAAPRLLYDEPYVDFTEQVWSSLVSGNWLDACRRGELAALLNLYDERATLECDCECVSLTGRKAIEAYWAPKLESKAILAFSLNAMALTADGVRVDYQSDEGKSVQIDFRFGPSGKILHTSCVPSEWCTVQKYSRTAAYKFDPGQCGRRKADGWLGHMMPDKDVTRHSAIFAVFSLHHQSTRPSVAGHFGQLRERAVSWERGSFTRRRLKKGC
jgi:hypothetical protein